MRYRANLGSISSKEEIAEIKGESKNGDAAAEFGDVPTNYSGEDPRSLARPIVAAQGWGDSEYQCLILLWNRESQWNPYA